MRKMFYGKTSSKSGLEISKSISNKQDLGCLKLK